MLTVTLDNTFHYFNAMVFFLSFFLFGQDTYTTASLLPH